MRFFWAYAGTAAMFLAADFVWLGFAANSFYRKQLGALMLDRPHVAPAALFYAGYVAAIVFFAVLPGLREHAWKAAAINGALLGAAAYATYDLTNLATLKNWPLAMSLVDLAWGTVATALAATVGYALVAYLER